MFVEIEVIIVSQYNATVSRTVCIKVSLALLVWIVVVHLEHLEGQ